MRGLYSAALNYGVRRRNVAALPRNSGGCGGILVFNSWTPVAYAAYGKGVQGRLTATVHSGGSLHLPDAPSECHSATLCHTKKRRGDNPTGVGSDSFRRYVARAYSG